MCKLWVYLLQLFIMLNDFGHMIIYLLLIQRPWLSLQFKTKPVVFSLGQQIMFRLNTHSQ